MLEKQNIHDRLIKEVEDSYIPQFERIDKEKIPNYFIPINFSIITTERKNREM